MRCRFCRCKYTVKKAFRSRQILFCQAATPFVWHSIFQIVGGFALRLGQYHYLNGIAALLLRNGLGQLGKPKPVGNNGPKVYPPSID